MIAHNFIDNNFHHFRFKYICLKHRKKHFFFVLQIELSCFDCELDKNIESNVFFPVVEWVEEHSFRWFRLTETKIINFQLLFRFDRAMGSCIMDFLIFWDFFFNFNPPNPLVLMFPIPTTWKVTLRRPTNFPSREDVLYLRTLLLKSKLWKKTYGKCQMGGTKN